jgi:hypothetical protein
MSWLSHAFGGNKNPANSANKYLSQIPQTMSPYFQPYINQGQQAGQQLTSQYNQMTQNPGEFYSNIGKDFKNSPGYAATLREALSGANNAAALGGGGGLGSYGHQELSAQAAGDVANQDYQKYIDHMMEVFGMGQKGQQQQQQQGFDASQRYGENLGNVLGQQGQYAFGGQAGQNANRGQNWSNLFSGLGNLLPYML